jgi:hypothetical protein
MIVQNQNTLLGFISKQLRHTLHGTVQCNGYGDAGSNREQAEKQGAPGFNVIVEEIIKM